MSDGPPGFEDEEALAGFTDESPAARNASDRDGMLQGAEGWLRDHWLIGPAMGVAIGRSPMAAAEGAKQGATFNFADEIGAAGEAIGVGKPQGVDEAYLQQHPELVNQGAVFSPGAWIDAGSRELVGQALAALGIKGQKPLGQRYDEALAPRRAELQAQQEADPSAFNAGDNLATLATAMVPVGQGVTAAKGLAGVGKAALTNATIGGALGGTAALGKSEADLAGGDVAGAAADTIKGAIPGMALGGVLGGAAHGAQQLALNSKRLAPLQAYAAAHPELKHFKIHSEAEQRAIGKRLLDEGFVEFGDAAGDIVDKLVPAREASGKAIGQTIDELTERMQAQGKESLTLQEAVTFISAKLDGKRQLSPEAKKILTEELQEKMVQYSQGQNVLDFGVLRAIKSDLQDLGKYEAAKTSRTSETYRNVAGGAKDFMNTEAKKVSPELGEQLEAQNQRHWELSAAEDISKEAALKAANSPIRRGIDLAGVGMAGALGGVLGGPGGAVPALVAAHVLRTRGRSSAAVLLQALSKVVGAEKAAQILEQLGTRAVPTAIGGEQ